MRYLGNKTRMIKNIESFINELNLDGNIFCDLFAGSCSVADHFKDRYKIICNDLLESSCYISSAKIHNSKVPEFSNFKKEYGKDIFSYLTNKEYEYSENHFIYNNYSPKGNRQFFTEEVANKIDGVRLEIERLFKEKFIDQNERVFLIASLLETIMGLSNTTGTYEAFLKKWDSRALKAFDLKPLSFEEKTLFDDYNLVYNEDANQLIRKISGDILYLDTPYTITDYNSAYHLLETVAKYDSPELKGLTGRRANKPEKSKYSIEKKAFDCYEDLIKNANFKHIIISYSTQSLIKIEDLINMLNKYSKNEVIVKYFPFREYKNIRASAKGSNLREVLIYLRKEDNNGY